MKKNYILKNLNFEREQMARLEKIGVKNLSEFVREAVDEKLRRVQSESLREYYNSGVSLAVLKDYNCTLGDGL